MTRGIVVDPAPEPSNRPEPKEPAQPAPTADDLPEKFQGKSVKEVVDMYANLESEAGRLRNELGDTRADARTWRSLAEELSTPTARPAPERKPVEVTPDNLLSQPKEAIRSVIDEALDDKLGPIVKETRNLQRNAEVEAFVRDFPNYVEVGQSTEFQHFVGKSRRRLSLAERALNKQDINAMRELMESWEERRQLMEELNPSAKKPDTEHNTAPTGVEGARKVATEKSGNGGGIPNTKVFYQADVMKTMLQNPDLYYSAPYQEELLAAMREGRFKS